jgi:peptide/nickel transport system permease protein
LGLDNLGRDILSRTIAGTRISLGIGLVVLCIAGVFGTIFGLVAGYFGGRVDEVMMRITDMFLAFPALILAMAFAALLGPNLVNTMIAISFVRWTMYARLVRGEVLRLRETEFVESARSLGSSHFRILFRHILPNALAPVIVRATMDMGAVILTAAGLSFIGFGAQPPTAEWGVMVSDGRQFIMTQWWVSTFPGLAILIVVLGFNLLGDGLRDVLDPRLRGY